MERPRLLLIDQGDSLLVNLTHQLDGRKVSLSDEPVVFAARGLSEARKALEKHPHAPWKVVVVGREGGLEPAALETALGIRAQFGADNPPPLLLVTRTSATQLAGLRKRLGQNGEVLAIDPAADLDLQDKVEQPSGISTAAEQRFDAVISAITHWASASPQSARTFRKT